MLLVFGIILIVIGGALLVPVSVWSFINQPLSSIGTDPNTTVTLDMHLVTYGTNNAITGKVVCGPPGGVNDLNNLAYLNSNSNTCFTDNYVGSFKDPWTVMDVGPISANVMVVAAGSLTYSKQIGAPSGSYVDISWYYAIPQSPGHFQVTQIARVVVNEHGSFNTLPFPIPTQANGKQIIIMGEASKGPLSSNTCDQNTVTSTALCYSQSVHYLVTVGSPSQYATQISVWVGQGCASTSIPSETSNCKEVWKDGKDIVGYAEVPVTLPFKVIIIPTQGPDIGKDNNFWVHAKNYTVSSTSPLPEQPTFPTPLSRVATYTRTDGVTVPIYSLTVGDTNCITGNTNVVSATPQNCDVQLAPGRYDVEFTTTRMSPWTQQSTVLAILQVGVPTSTLGVSFPSISMQQGAGILFIVFGLGVVGLAMIPRKPP